MHCGNTVRAGQQYPLIVTRRFGDGAVNGQVMLDGSDTLWVTSVFEGEQPGQYVRDREPDWTEFEDTLSPAGSTWPPDRA